MRYEILKDFKGSQTGATTENFTAGSVVELSDWLANAVPPGHIRPVAEQAGEQSELIENKAVLTDGKATGKRRKG